MWAMAIALMTAMEMVAMDMMMAMTLMMAIEMAMVARRRATVQVKATHRRTESRAQCGHRSTQPLLHQGSGLAGIGRLHTRLS